MFLVIVVLKNISNEIDLVSSKLEQNGKYTQLIGRASKHHLSLQDAVRGSRKKQAQFLTRQKLDLDNNKVYVFKRIARRDESSSSSPPPEYVYLLSPTTRITTTTAYSVYLNENIEELRLQYDVIRLHFFPKRSKNKPESACAKYSTSSLRKKSHIFTCTLI